MQFPETRTAHQFGKQCRSMGYEYDVGLGMLERNDIAVKDATEFAAGYNGHPVALHFVNFRGDEYNRAVRVFGRPHFIHRIWDHRVMGDVAPGDTVVFAKDDDSFRPCPFTFNDSECF